MISLCFLVCFCTSGILSQEVAKDVMPSLGSSSTKVETDSFVDELLKSLYFATADELETTTADATKTFVTVSDATTPHTTTTTTSVPTTIASTTILPSTTMRKSRVIPSQSYSNNLNVFIQKIASLSPEDFDQFASLLNVSKTENSKILARAEVDVIPDTTDREQLFTSEIEGLVANTTEDSRISNIISVLSKVLASNNDEIDTTTSTQNTETTTTKSPFTVLPIMTFEKSSAGSEVTVGTNETNSNSTSVDENTQIDSSNNTLSSKNDNSSGSKPYPIVKDTLSYKPDFFVFGILPNGTVVRKRPSIIVPGVVFGVLPNDTLIQKFPNGSFAPLPMDMVIQVSGIDNNEDTTEAVDKMQRSLNKANVTANLLSRFANEKVLQENLTDMTPSTLPEEEINANALAVLSSTEQNTPTLMDLLIGTLSTTTPVAKEIVIHQNQNHEMEKIQELLEKQQGLLDQLRVIVEKSTKAKSSRKETDLTERVMAKIIEMTEMVSTTNEPSTNIVELTTSQVEEFSATTTERKSETTKPKYAIITDKQIETLIAQLEVIKRNPEKIKKLDVDSLKRLHKFENFVENVSEMAEEKLNDTHLLSNRFGNDETTISSTVKNSTESVTEKADPKFRAQVVAYGVGISKAITSFFATTLQEASNKFIKSLTSSYGDGLLITNASNVTNV
ncbi:hypothetical protein FQA39_LY10282 [Lamprigera yunnana]|nr:hypothetical protein FQA39_LY10282 [Lamprigera yunnana]